MDRTQWMESFRFSRDGERQRTPEFTAFADGGNFSTGRGGAELSGLLGQFDYSAGVSDLETQGQGPNDAFRNRTLSGNFGWKLHGHGADQPGTARQR